MYYGFVSERGVVEYIDAICELLPNKDDRRVLMIATAYQETKMGRYKDPSTNRNGEGLFQFDPSIIEDTLSRTKKRIRARLEEKFDIDLDEVTHKNLNNMPLIQTILAALKYWIVPEPLPNKNDFDGMWNYYKIYFNSIKGKATKEEFRDAYNYALELSEKYK